MDAIAILQAVANMMPAAKIIIAQIAALQGKQEPGIVSIVSALLPAASALMTQLQMIHNQTKDTNPQVWKAVSKDFKDTADAWDALQRKTAGV